MFSKWAFRDDDMSHEELFGHLASDNFTAQEASEYLEVSMRSIADGRLDIQIGLRHSLALLSQHSRHTHRG